MEKMRVKNLLIVIIYFLYMLAVQPVFDFIYKFHFITTGLYFILDTFIIWIVYIMPAVLLMFFNKEKLKRIGFSKERIIIQIFCGVIWGFASVFLFVIPVF